MIMTATFKTQIKTTERLLPKDWQWVKFGAIIGETQPGFASGQRDSKGVIQMRMNNLNTRGNLLWDDFIRVPTDQTAIEKFSLKVGDIVFNNTNSTELVGKSALFTGHDEPVTYSNHFTRLRTKPDIADPEFVTFWLISQWQAKTFANICNRWIGQSAVKTDKLFALEIPLPPLDEQRRIAKRLNEQMAAVESARKAAEEQLQAARRLPFAYLREVFENHGWKSTNLGSLCTIVRGSSPRPKGDPRYYGGKVPRLMVEDVTRDGMYVTPRVDFLTEEGSKLSRPMKKGDVVMVVSGAPGLPGILSVDACIHDGFVGFRELQKEKILPEFLYFGLQYYRAENDKEATGAIFRNLTTDQVGKFKIPIPALDIQREIVGTLSRKLDSTKDLVAMLESQLAEINRLPASLLREGFAGRA